MKHNKTIDSFLKGSRLVALAILSLLVPSLTQAATSYLYIESNIGQVPDQNSILAYSNDGAGNLSALPGSPYLTGGTGVYDPTVGPTEFDADQQVIADGTGNLLYAVNGNSNSIAAFNIGSDGSLTTLAGSPFPSLGHDPVSVGIEVTPGRDTLMVVNKNEDPNQNNSATVPNYVSYAINADGTLADPSTSDLTAGSSPAQALCGPKRRLFFGLEFLTSRLTSYKVGQGRVLQPVSSLDTPAGSGDHFLGGVMNPKKRILYVGFPVGNFIGVYQYTTDGALSLNRMVQNPGHLVCWLTINPSATLLFASETGTGTVTSYSLAAPLNPVVQQHIALSGSNQSPSNIALDPSGQFLYVLAGHNLHVLNVDSAGNMSETLAPVVLPVPAGETPLGLAAIQK